MTKHNPFRYFKTSPEIIRLAVMMYVRYPLSVEDLLHERGIDVSHETVRFWWNRFGPLLAADIRKKRVKVMRSYTQWQWHLDEVFVKMQGSAEVFAQSHETIWATLYLRHRSPPNLQSGTAGPSHGGSPTNRPLAEQQGRKLTPTVPTTRTGHAALQADAKSTKVRISPFLSP